MRHYVASPEPHSFRKETDALCHVRKSVCRQMKKHPRCTAYKCHQRLIRLICMCILCQAVLQAVQPSLSITNMIQRQIRKRIDQTGRHLDHRVLVIQIWAGIFYRLLVLSTEIIILRICHFLHIRICQGLYKLHTCSRFKCSIHQKHRNVFLNCHRHWYCSHFLCCNVLHLVPPPCIL